MKLVIDVGNTSSKLAVFDRTVLVDVKRLDNSKLLNALEELLIEYRVLSSALISKVGHLDSAVVQLLKKRMPVHLLSYKSKLPFVNAYTTPHTLGVDRIALAAAAVSEYPKTNVLVIDAGTCITNDFVDAESTYLGGSMSPGLRIRYESLHNFTANLPLLKQSVPQDLIGVSTEEAIHSGVILGTCKEINGIIDAYRLRYKHLTVILTGGDTKILSDQLKNSIFANSNFLLAGLNYLLDYNS